MFDQPALSELLMVVHPADSGLFIVAQFATCVFIIFIQADAAILSAILVFSAIKTLNWAGAAKASARVKFSVIASRNVDTCVLESVMAIVCVIA